MSDLRCCRQIRELRDRNGHEKMMGGRAEHVSGDKEMPAPVSQHRDIGI